MRIIQPIQPVQVVKTSPIPKVIKASPVNINITSTGGSQPVIDFTWNVTNPFSLGTFLSGRRLVKVLLGITIPFNNGAQISIGDAGQSDRYMAANQNYPNIAEEFTASPFYKFASNTELLLTFSNNSLTTQGAGTVILFFDS